MPDFKAFFTLQTFVLDKYVHPSKQVSMDHLV